jgi:hypothetical protein
LAAFQYYYQTEDDFELQIHRLLKLFICPHCKRVGTLILNGLIRGYSESSSETAIRGHYLICNKRRKEGRRGCGKSFSVFLAETLKHLSISTKSFWKFLQNMFDGDSTVAAFRGVLNSSFSDSTIHRLRARFNNIQAKIRTRLLTICSAPHSLTASPLLQTIAHLKAAFRGTDDPIALFQIRFNERFF